MVVLSFTNVSESSTTEQLSVALDLLGRVDGQDLVRVHSDQDGAGVRLELDILMQ